MSVSNSMWQLNFIMICDPLGTSNKIGMVQRRSCLLKVTHTKKKDLCFKEPVFLIVLRNIHFNFKC